MKDQKCHITERSDDITLNGWIHYLLHSVKEGKKVLYTEGDDENFSAVNDDHTWNFERYTYRVISPREYIVRINKDGEASLVQNANRWTRSDFGKNTDGSEFILMREVDLYKE